MSRKRKELCLKEKIFLIKESPGQSQRFLAEKYGIGKTQVANILKRKADLLDGYEENKDHDRKRICKRSPVDDVNSLMWEWFQRKRSLCVPLSGPMLQERALKYAEELGISTDTFKASNGWLGCFKKRHNIQLANVCGEAGSVSTAAVEDWKQQLPTLLEGYTSDDIFNMDETGLFYRALPNKTLAIRGEQCKGGKKAKERLTVALCVNMNGVFEKPLVIGKSEKPRCFKNVDKASLPVTWTFNAKAWMTTQLFIDWVKSFNRRMRAAKRNVLLLLDNAPSHPQSLELSNIKLLYLPANTTSHLQPLDQGIIKTVKEHYKMRQLRSVLARIDATESGMADNVAKSISVLDAVHWISAAVKDVKASTVTKCFAKAGMTEAMVDDEEDITPIAQLAEMMKAAKDKITCSMTAEEFVNLDSDIPVNADCDQDWENTLVQEMQANHEMVESDEEVEEHEDRPSIQSCQEALRMISDLNAFLLTHNMGSANDKLRDIQDDIESQQIKVMAAAKQSTITQFFK